MNKLRILKLVRDKNFIKSILPMSIRTKIPKLSVRDKSIKIYKDNSQIFIDKGNVLGAVPVYYFDNTPNFGDLVGPYLVSKITNKPVVNIVNSKNPGVMTVGSILQMIDRKGLVICGSGLISPLDKDTIKRIKFFNPTIKFVRGYETAKSLKNIGVNITNEESYGDPALILPMFYTPNTTKLKKIGICPHYKHKEIFDELKISSNGFNFIDVQKDLESVINAIYSSNVCISTSLHGLIVSQAYGIPWVWIEITDENLSGEDFKFKDFFSTLDSDQVAHIKTTKDGLKDLNFDEIAEKASLPNAFYDQNKILEALENVLLPT